MNEDRNQELRKLGFHCLQPTKVRFLDGAEVTVTAHSFCDGKERCSDRPADLRALRFYAIRQRVGGTLEIVNELALENRMGQERFRRLV
jgi:hypothetical protein